MDNEQNDLNRIADELVKQAMIQAAFTGKDHEVHISGYVFTAHPNMEVSGRLARPSHDDDDDFDPPLQG